jgi:hypothetical protein
MRLENVQRIYLTEDNLCEIVNELSMMTLVAFFLLRSRDDFAKTLV